MHPDALRFLISIEDEVSYSHPRDQSIEFRTSPEIVTVSETLVAVGALPEPSFISGTSELLPICTRGQGSKSNVIKQLMQYVLSGVIGHVQIRR